MAGLTDRDAALSCAELVELVTDYLEGQVDARLRAEIEAHLALCSGCGRYLEQMRQTLRLLGRVPVETLGDDARAEIMAAFRTFHPRAP